jgi:hypothetical protein
VVKTPATIAVDRHDDRDDHERPHRQFSITVMVPERKPSGREEPVKKA